MTRPTPAFFLPMVYTIYLFCVASIILLSACHEKNVEAFLPVVPTKISISGVGVGVGVGVRHSNDNDNSQGGVVRVDLSALLPTLGSISSHGLSTSSNSGTRLSAVPQKRIARRDLKKVGYLMIVEQLVSWLAISQKFISFTIIELFILSPSHSSCILCLFVFDEQNLSSISLHCIFDIMDTMNTCVPCFVVTFTLLLLLLQLFRDQIDGVDEVATPSTQLRHRHHPLKQYHHPVALLLPTQTQK